MTNLRLTLIATFALLVFGLQPAPVEARGVVLWGNGEDIVELAEIPDSDDEKLGYMYSYFSLFWMNAWTWNGRFVVFSDDNTYLEIPTHDASEVASALGVAESAVRKPLCYLVPTCSYLLLGVLCFLGYQWRASRQQAQSEKDLQLAIREERKAQREADNLL